MNVLSEDLKTFVEEDFNSITYTSNIIKNATIPESLQQLSGALNGIDKELNSQVALHHEELLSQVSNVKELEDMLEVVKNGIDTLQGSINKIAVEISEPTKLIGARTKQLSRLQETCETLRRVIRFLYLARKLKGHMQGGTRELAKAAQCLLELDLLRKESDLLGIQVIDQEIRGIIKANEEVMNSAARMLLQGTETQNQAESAAALQVFYNLGTLREKMDGCISMLDEKVRKAIQSVVVYTNENKNTLWNRVEKLMDTLHISFTQVYHLQRVLSKIRDPTTHICLIDELVKPGEPTIIQTFWMNVCSKLAQQLEAATKQTPLEAALVNDFPRLNRFFCEFLKRLQTNYEVKQVKAPLSVEEQQYFLDSIVHYRQLYLHRLFGKLTDAINKLFIGNAIPSVDEINNLVTGVSAELESARLSNDELLLAVANNVYKALKYFSAKAEGMIVSDASAYQLSSETCTPTQIRNAKLFSSIWFLYSGMNSALKTPNVIEIVQPALKEMQKIAEQIISPLFARISKHLEQTLLAIHKEDFGGSEVMQVEAQTCSPYVKSLQYQIYGFNSALLSKFANSTWMHSQMHQLASRLLILFVRHAALIRPLGEAGKLKLTADMAQLELAIANLQPLNEIGAAYRAMRAMRPLIFKDTSQIAEGNEKDILLPSTILHHLFGRGPNTLQLPPALHRWSLGQYSEWMDQHNEEEIWNMLKQSLDVYATQVNARGEKQFHPIYPVLISIGPQLVKKWKEQNTSQ